ncbi:MAG: hypothetical protein RSD43_07290 [Anaerovoracaceae bacterium]
MFYNGALDSPAEGVLYLSDMFPPKYKEDSDIDLRVHSFNVNYDNGAKLLGRCQTLKSYSYIVHLLRRFKAEGCSDDEAIGKLQECCNDDKFVVEFIKEIGEEGIAMLFDKLTIDEMLEIRKNDGLAEGIEKGREEGREEGREAGLKEGREEGRKDGIEEGREEEKLSIARNLLIAQADINIIAKATGLSVEEIEKLK